MKTVLALLILLLPFTGSARSLQGNPEELVIIKAEIADLIADAIRTGNAKEIAKYFAENVDLKVLEQENIYSRAQAELILKDFFAKHPVQEFTIVHKSTPKNNSQFATGTLKTTSGVYRVHYLMKTSGASTTVTQFRIENSEE
jgi:hypothetical protein